MTFLIALAAGLVGLASLTAPAPRRIAVRVGRRRA